jgi:hypothetical protein
MLTHEVLYAFVHGFDVQVIGVGPHHGCGEGIVHG